MHRSVKIFIGALLLGSSIGIAIWLLNLSEKKQLAAATKTEKPVSMDIINKRVISGNLVPHKEIALKAQMAGIVDKLYVAVGDKVAKGTPIARIKALPRSGDIEAAEKALRISQLALGAAKARYQRNKQLFEKKMLSLERYEDYVKTWKIAHEEAAYAQKHLDIVRKGQTTGAQVNSNIVKAIIAGIVLELPLQEGSVVMEQSSFNEGSTIANIADMRTVLFQGKVGEMDVGYLSEGMTFEISLNAIKGKKFQTTLTKLAPKAIESRGEESIKFAIEGKVQLKKEDIVAIRAGYTAMADIILEKATDVLAIKEKCLHVEDPSTQAHMLEGEEARKDNTTFVWVYENNQKVKKSVKLGISDGIYVEVKEGLTENDQVIIE